MQEHTVDCSGYIVLECTCEERLVLLGDEDDWYSEGHLTFTCGCGAQLTLGNRRTDTAER